MIARFGSSPMTSGKTNVAPNIATTCWAPMPTVRGQDSRSSGRDHLTGRRRLAAVDDLPTERHDSASSLRAGDRVVTPGAQVDANGMASTVGRLAMIGIVDNIRTLRLWGSAQHGRPAPGSARRVSTSGSCRMLAGAASTALRDAAWPARRAGARVACVGVHPGCVYLDWPASRAARARDRRRAAAALRGARSRRARAAGRSPAVRRDDDAAVGEGRSRVGPLAVRVAPVVAPAGRARCRAGHAAAATRTALRRRCSPRLPAELPVDRPDACAAGDLLGLGPGLTPAGRRRARRAAGRPHRRAGPASTRSPPWSAGSAADPDDGAQRGPAAARRRRVTPSPPRATVADALTGAGQDRPTSTAPAARGRPLPSGHRPRRTACWRDPARSLALRAERCPQRGEQR